MRKTTVLLAACAIANAGCFSAATLPANAGVVIDETQQVNNGRMSRETKQTVIIQGNKQKMVTDQVTTIIDLDKGKIYRLFPSRKSYMEMEFPPPPPMATMMASTITSSMNLKKTSAKQDIAGYKCTNYDGGGDTGRAQYTITQCVSKDAPGAEIFTTFEKAMEAKVTAAAKTTPTGEIPEGLPLSMDLTMKPSIPAAARAKMPADRLKEMEARMAKRPPMTNKTVVSKVETKTLPDDTFEIPKDFTKQANPMMGGIHMMAPGAVSAKASGAAAPASAAPAASTGASH
ncbi:MAG TPA: DUF4412 domain-containing protein [Candidatus Binataceae bacterium]|nr:DUF4412 domain-containing protein [Candidatus Binataceae bacterium]